MSDLEHRMRRLEQQAARRTAPDGAYWSALRRTNTTGMASLADYALTQAGLAGEVRAAWSSQAPFVRAVMSAGVEVLGLATIAAVPPSEHLPAASRTALSEVCRVVKAVPDRPVGQEHVGHRIDCATWYLALGDAQGLPIRAAVWERVGDRWRHTRHVEFLARSSGMTDGELSWWSQAYPQLIPDFDHPEIQERLSGTGPSPQKISWWELAKIVEARAAGT